MSEVDPSVFSPGSEGFPAPGSAAPQPGAQQAPPLPEPADLPDGFCDSPEWFPTAFDGSSGQVTFTKRTADELSGVAAASGDAETTSAAVASVARTMTDAKMQPKVFALIAGTPGAPCGALARALDACASAEARDKPAVVGAMANLRRRLPMTQEAMPVIRNWGFATQTLHRLVVRTFNQNKTAVVAIPENAVNITPELLSASREARAILIHQPVERSVSGSFADKSRRNELVGLGARSMVDLRSMQLMPNINTQALSDPCRSAFAWAASMWFIHILAQRVPQRVRSLSWEDAMRDPEATLRAAAGFLGLTLDEGKVAAGVKILTDQDPTGEQDGLIGQNQPDAAEVRQMITAIYKRRPMPGTLPSAFLGE